MLRLLSITQPNTRVYYVLPVNLFGERDIDFENNKRKTASIAIQFTSDTSIDPPVVYVVNTVWYRIDIRVYIDLIRKKSCDPIKKSTHTFKLTETHPNSHTRQLLYVVLSSYFLLFAFFTWHTHGFETASKKTLFQLHVDFDSVRNVYLPTRWKKSRKTDRFDVHSGCCVFLLFTYRYLLGCSQHTYSIKPAWFIRSLNAPQNEKNYMIALWLRIT